jgi:hypothetical protein
MFKLDYSSVNKSSPLKIENGFCNQDLLRYILRENYNIRTKSLQRNCQSTSQESDWLRIWSNKKVTELWLYT